MTFTIKIRGSTDRPIAAEYLCPVHGRFTLTVDRDANGDPAVSRPCPMPIGCDDDGCTKEHAPCALPSPYVISAPLVGVRRVEAVKGGWQKPERPTWLDTRDLGEGQDIDEWRQKREAIRDQQRRDSLKELLDG